MLKLMAACLLPLVVGQGPQEWDPADAIQSSTRWREAIATLQVKYDRIPTVQNKVKIIHCDLAIGVGGRYSLIALAEMADGTKDAITNERTDGRRTYQEAEIDGDVKQSSFVSILEARSTADDYKGPMCDFLWLTLPTGKPVSRLLKSDGVVLQTRRENGSALKHVFVIGGIGAKGQIQCELNDAREWLPAAIEIANPPVYKARVTRYERIEGIDFPWEGEVSAKDWDGYWEDHRFIVRKLEVNKEIPEAVFKPRGVVPGTLVMNHMTLKANVVGGGDARDQLLGEAAAPDSMQDAEPVRARIESESRPRGTAVLLLGSLALLVAGIFIRVRHHKRVDVGRP